ncbi:MAG: hypothetical protein ACTS4U_00460 [Candidatus Hodgkinia cicadicola]
MYSLCKAATKASRRLTSEVYVNEGQRVKGIVKFKTEVGALIDIGRTSFGLLLNRGSWSFRQLQVGDSVETYVEEVGIPPNEFLLSRRHLDEENAWSAVFSAWRNDEPVEAEVVAPTLGGIEMRTFGLPAGLIWDSETVGRVRSLPRGALVTVKIASAVRDSGLIVLFPAGTPNVNSKDFKLNISVWGEIIGPLLGGYLLNVCGLSAVLKFEGIPWFESLRFTKAARRQQLVLVNVRKQSLTCVEEAWNVTELVRASVQIVDEMQLSDEMLTSEGKVATSAAIAPPNVMNVSPREKYFDSKEIDWINREWAVADRDWSQGLKYGFLRTSERLIDCKRGSSFLPPKHFYEVERPIHPDVEGKVDELNWISPDGPINSLRERTFAQIDRDQRKEAALTCGWEQTRWMEFIKAKTTETTNVENELQRSSKVCETFDESDWDENEMYRDEEVEEEVDEPSDFEYESETAEGEVERKCETAEEVDALPFEEKLIRSWKRKLNVNELRESADKVFDGGRRGPPELEVTLAASPFGKPSRSLRSIYGVIVGLDLQSGLIVMKAANDIFVLVAEASFTLNDTYLFEKNATFGSGAIKMLPVAFCPFMSSVIVEIDVDGFRLLKFIETYGRGPFVGSIAKIEPDGFVIALQEGMWGKLSAEGDHFAGCDCINAKVLVSICDVNVATNVLNLEFAEDEESRTILEEVS